MFVVFMTALLIAGIAGCLFALYADKRNRKKTWKACMYYLSAYAVIMVLTPIVSVMKHWTIFDKVSGMFVAAAASVFGAIYTGLKINTDTEDADV